MDDRAALAIATEAGRRLAGRDDLAYEVWLASTIQEENGLIGAASLQDEETFDLGIALDVGLTGDIPGVDERDFPCKLGDKVRSSSIRMSPGSIRASSPTGSLPPLAVTTFPCSGPSFRTTAVMARRSSGAASSAHC